MIEDSKVLPPLNIRCVGAEDLIGLKIQAISNNPARLMQDQADIVALAKKYPQLDREKVKSYADIFGLWTKIQPLL